MPMQLVTPGDMTRQAFRVAQNVAANTTMRFEQSVNRPATVERVSVRIYAGPQMSLRITPFVTNQLGMDRPLIYTAVGAKKWLDGDDDTFEFKLREPISENDILVVNVVNLDPANAYDFAVDFEVDYLGGEWPTR